MKLHLFATVAALAIGERRRGCAGARSAGPARSRTFSRLSTSPPGTSQSEHLRIIDGTGAAPVEDATLLIDGAKIGAVLPGPDPVPAGYRMLDGTGETAMPGLVGMHNHMYYIARPNLDASGHSDDPLLRSADDVQRAASVSRERRHDDADDRKRGALHRPQCEGGDRCRPHGRAAHGRDRALSRRARKPLHSDAPAARRRRMRGETVAFWADAGRDLVQGVHEHHPCRAQSGDRRGASAASEDHGSFMLGDLSRGRRARDRRSRARVLRQHAARSRQAG